MYLDWPVNLSPVGLLTSVKILSTSYSSSMCDPRNTRGCSRASKKTGVAVQRGSFVAPSGITISYIIHDGRGRDDCDRPLDTTRPAILAIHDIGFNSSYWMCMMKHMCDQADVIAVDLPYSGQTGAAEELTLETLGTDLAALMESLVYPRYSLVGQGVGGIVALYMASVYTETIRRVVVSSTNPQPLPQPDTDYIFPFSPVLQRVLTSISSAAPSELCGLSRTLSAILDNDQTDGEAEYGILAAQYANAQPQIAAFYELLLSVNIRDLLTNIVVPVMIISGTEDPAVPVGAAGILREGIRESAMVELYGAGHNIPIRRTAQFNDLVSAFLFISTDVCMSTLITNNCGRQIICPSAPCTTGCFYPEYYANDCDDCSSPQQAATPSRTLCDIAPRYVR